MIDFMNFKIHNLRRRWPLLVLAGTVVGGLTYGGLRVQSLVREMLPGFLKSRLEAALGRQVRFGRLHVWPMGVWIDDVRVLRGQEDKADPLAARRLHVTADWWRLVTTQQLRVDAVELEGAKLRLTPVKKEKPEEQPWTTQVLDLSRAGINRFGLRNASVHVLDSSTGKATFQAEGVAGDLRVQPAVFHYQARVKQFTGGGALLSDVRLTGTGDRDGLQVQEGRAGYRKGRLQATGTIRTGKNAVGMTIHVEDLPLSDLAAEMRMPAEWAVNGRVSGKVQVDALDNTLRGVQGTLRVTRGSVARDGSRFPWNAARARIAWTPEGATLRDVRIEGGGVTLKGEGEVSTPPGRSLTESAFRISGTIRAERGDAVARVAELLAFRRQLLDGRWQAGSASIDFQAQGSAGDLSKATASGRIRVDGLQFRPRPGSEAVRVARLEARLERTPGELVLRDVTGQAEGLTLAGELKVTDERPGKPAQFLAAGTVGIKDIKSIRQALPDAAVWKWIPAVSSNASGSLRFRLEGPAADLARVRGDGRFEVLDFRFSMESPLPSGTMFYIPMDAIRGALHYADNRLNITDLELDARTFDARGQMDLTFDGSDPAVTTELYVKTDNWRSLPAMPVGALPELSNGDMEGTLKVSGRLSQLSESPIDGWFRLTDASYTPTREGAVPIPVRELAADFRWGAVRTEYGRVLELPSVSMDSPVLSATANGRIYPDQKDYRLSLDIEACTDNTGELVARFTEDVRLGGGSSRAKFHADAPVERIAEGRITGTLESENMKLLHAVEPLGLKEIDARTLSMEFAGDGGRWDLPRVSLEAPGLAATLKGSFSGQMLDADVELRADRWTAPESLPVSGGTLALNGRFAGDAAKAESLTFAGELTLDGAQLRYAGEEAAASGGTLKLTARGEGSLADAVKWVQSGKIHLAGARVTPAGKPEQKLDLLSADFAREGDRFRIENLRLAGAGIEAAGSAEWAANGYRLALAGEMGDPARYGFELPKGLSAQKYRVNLQLLGTSEKAVVTADGRLEVEGVRVGPGALWEKSPQQTFERVAGAFHYEDDRLRVEGLEGRGPLGTLTASGEWSAKSHRLVLTAAGDDFGRLGLELPEGVAIKTYHLQGELAGTAEKPFSKGSGTVRIGDVKFPFGPEGPHHLKTVSSPFTLDGDRITLSRIVTEGPAGHFTGTGLISSETWRVALTTPRASASLARWMLPGTVDGGELAGTLNMEGSMKATPESGDAVRVVSGRFELKNARYTLPEKMGLVGDPAAVSRFAGTYHWENGRTVLTALNLATDILDASGTVTVQDGKGTVKTDLTTADMGRVTDFWPGLRALLKGGAGTGKLELTFDENSSRGTLAVTARGGTILLPQAPPEFAEQPLETASLILGFEPKKLTFTGVELRGPKGNLDGNGVWNDQGDVSAKGKAWFTREFTSRMIKPTGFGWLAKLAGIRQIKSDFTLGGTSDRVILKAGITDTLMWKLAKGQMPKEFQDVAAGKTPLWVQPTEEQNGTTDEHR
jgi:hypothetical protein